MKNLLLISLSILVILISSCNKGQNWDATKLENTVSAYEEFLANYPETGHKDSVLLLIRELDWLFAKNANSMGALDSFQIKHPENEEYIDSVKNLKDDLVYDEVLSKNTIDAYRKFMEDYPENRNRYEANGKIEMECSKEKQQKRRNC